MLPATAFLIAAGVTSASACAADDAEVNRLRKRIELLEAKLKLAEHENAALRKVVDELKTGKEGEAKDGNAAADSFAVGTVWVGHRKPANSKGHEWQFRVTARIREGFKGEITLNRPDGTFDTYEVEGKAPVKGDGAVSFKSVKKGFFQQSFAGKVIGGEIALTYSGRGSDGSPQQGTATLKPKN
jgi:hypothetical protein